MNQNRHRLVFNVRRGLWMAVAETARSQGKARGEGGPAEAAVVPRWWPARPLALLLAALGTQAALAPAAWSQIVAYRNAPGSQRPTVLTAGNGVPLVNIQTPSEAGVSHNTYSQFDVDDKGAILNNSRKGAGSQLAGPVGGNPWLARGTARVILNEVVSSDPSKLRGAVEVAGDKAEVVIANPAGIDVDGSGFINASRATLTTGKTTLRNGAIDGYEVRQGTVTVGSRGLDASQTDYTAVLARAVKVNGAIYAKELKVVTGANRISADHKEIKPIAGTGPAPEFALDVAELGGMYAGKITLIGTEAGVGVRNAGKIAASAGEVVITVDGKLINTGQIVATGNADIDAGGGLDNQGTAYAQGAIKVVTRRAVTNTGLIGAQGDATLVAAGDEGEIVSLAGSALIAGLSPDGTFSAVGNLTLDAGRRLQASGQNHAGERLEATSPVIGIWGSDTSAPIVRLEALPNNRRSRTRRDPNGNLLATALGDNETPGAIDAAGATIVAEQLFAALTDGVLRTDNARIVVGRVEIGAHDLSNRGGQIVQTGATALTVNLPGQFDNTGGTLYGAGDTTLIATDLRNDAGTLGAGGRLNVQTSGHLANGSGWIAGAGGTRVDAGSLDSAGWIDGPVTTRATLTNSGTINGAASAGTDLSNAGLIQGSAGAGGDLGNTGGIAGDANAGLSLGNTGSIGGSASAGGALHNAGGIGGGAQAGTELSNAATGTIGGNAVAGGALDNSGQIAGNTRAGTGLTNSGDIGGFAVAGTTLDNSGRIARDAEAGSHLGNSGRIGGNALAGGSLCNSGGIGGSASAGGSLSNGGTIAGSAYAGGDLGNSGGIGGSASAGGNLGNGGSIGGSASAGGALDNAGGIGGSAAAGGSLSNSGGIGGSAAAGGGLGNAGTIGGYASAGGDLSNGGSIGGSASGANIDNTGNIGGSAYATDRIVNSGAIGSNGGNVTIGADRITNTGTLGGTSGNTTIGARTIDNRLGTLQAGQDLIVASTGQLDNRDGKIAAGGLLAIVDGNGSANANDKTQTILNTHGSLSAGSRLVIDSARLSFDGKVVSRGDFSAALQGDYTRGNGDDFFQATGAVSLSFTGTVTNDTVWHVDKGLGVTGGQVINRGEISSNGTTLVQATSGTLSNPGLIQGDKVFALGVDLANQGGRILGNSLTATFTGHADNTGGRIDIAGAADLQVGGNLLNDAGRIDTGSLNLTVGGNLASHSLAADQRAGITARAGDLSLDVGGNLDLRGADLSAAGKLTGFVLGDIRVDTLAIDKHSAETRGSAAWLVDATRSSSSESTTTHLAADLHAGGDLSLIAGGNARFQGVDITAGGALTLGAVTGDLTVGAAIDRDVRHRSQFAADPMANPGDGGATTGGLLTTTDSRTESAVGGRLAAGGAMDLLAGHDLNLSGVDARAGGKLQVLAGHNIHAGSLAITNSSARQTEDTRPANPDDGFWAAPAQDSGQHSIATTQVGGHFGGATGATFNAGHGNPFAAPLVAEVQTARQAAGLVAAMDANAPIGTPTPGRLSFTGVVIAAGSEAKPADLVLAAAGDLDVKATWDSTSITTTTAASTNPVLARLLGQATGPTTTTTVGTVLGQLSGQNITIQSDTGHLALAGLDIQAKGDLTSHSGGDTALDSSTLRAGHDLSVHAQGQLNIDGMIANPTAAAAASGILATAETRDNDHTPISAVAALSAGHDLTLTGIKGVQARAVDLTAANALAIGTLGTLAIEGGVDHVQRGEDFIRDTARASTLTGKTVTLSALGEKSDLALTHVALSSTGKTSLLATGDIRIDPGADYRYDHWTESHKSGGFFNKKTTTIDHVREYTTIAPSSLQAGALDIHAEGDIRLVATKIDSTDALSIMAGGNIDYLAAHHESYVHDESQTRKSLFGVFTYGRSSSSHTATGQTALVTSLQSAADVFSYSTADTTLEGTRIVSTAGKVQVLAGQNLDIRAAGNTSFVEDKFKSWSLVGNSLDYALNHKVKDETSTSSTTLTGAHLAGNSVELVAGGNAHLVATTLLGQTGVTVMAGGSVIIESGQDTFSTHHEHQESGHGVRVIKTDGRVHVVAPNENFEKLRDNGSTVTPVASVLASAQGAVSVAGGLDVALLGTKINAATDVNLTAGQRLLLGGALASVGLENENEKGTIIGRMRDGESLATQTGTVVPGSIDAGGKLNLTAGTAVELGAVDLRSGGATVFDAPAVAFVAERNSDYLSRKVWDKDRGYEVNQGNGHVDERLVLATIDAKGGITLPDSTKVSVQLDGHLLDPAGNAAASTAGQERLTAVTPAQFRDLAHRLSLQPGMAYLADLANRSDIDWQAVSTAHQQWDYQTQGLTQTGAIVLTVVVAILTYGAGAEMLTAAGSTTTSTAAGAVAGTTVTTTTGLGTITTATTTIATGATTTTVAATAAGAAASAAVTSLATSAAISFANNGGDLGKTLEDLGSSETVKGMLTSMITAGITTAEIFPSGDKMISLNQMANVQTIPGLGSVGTFNWDNLGQTALGVAGRSIVSAGVGTAINGGSFEDSFRQSLVSDLAAIGANAIGTTWGGGKDPLLQTAAHGLLGCAVGAAKGGDCAAGALGAGAESVLGNLIPVSIDPATGRYSTLTSALYTGGAVLFADIIADATGLDSAVAMDAARNAAMNNRLATQQEKDRIRQLAGGDPEKEQRLTAASCALIHCSAQFAEGSEAWRVTRALEIEGNRPEYAGDRTLLRNQAGMFGYTTNGLLSDKNLDAARLFDNTYAISTRTGGALQLIGGVATGVAGVGMVALGGATCLETGVGCFVAAGGTAVTGWSADQTRTGWNTVVTGQHQPTLGGAWISDTFGVSPQTGELIYGLAGLSPAAIEANAIYRTSQFNDKINSLTRATYGDFITSGVVVTRDVLGTPQGQALIKEIQAGSPSMSLDEATQYAKGYIESGAALPQLATAPKGATLVKIVPAGDAPSATTGFWLSPEQARAVAVMSPEQAAQVLGLPAAQTAKLMTNGVDFYAISVKPGATANVFVSDVASTVQGTIQMPGGLQQVIVPNRNLWTAPVRTNPFNLSLKRP